MVASPEAKGTSKFFSIRTIGDQATAQGWPHSHTMSAVGPSHNRLFWPANRRTSEPAMPAAAMRRRLPSGLNWNAEWENLDFSYASFSTFNCYNLVELRLPAFAPSF